MMKISNVGIKSTNWYFLFAIFFLVMPAASIYAVDIPNILLHLKDSATPIIKLTTAVSYVIGFWLAVSAIKDLKVIGESHGAPPGGGGLGGPLARFAIGVALVYLPSTIGATMVTLWGSDSIKAYTADRAGFTQVKEAAVLLVRAIGYISFIRGFVILSHATEQGAQQGTLGKGIMHIVGGVLAINIVATIDTLKETMGF
jgi:intracellular multiplication protein IcmC